jgi:hypothetical protein
VRDQVNLLVSLSITIAKKTSSFLNIKVRFIYSALHNKFLL